MTGPTLHINDRKQIKRMKSLICLALFFLALSVRGQGITLTGNVRDGKDQLALQDVNVVISSQGHKDITAYTISDQKGSFRLTCTPAKDNDEWESYRKIFDFIPEPPESNIPPYK